MTKTKIILAVDDMSENLTLLRSLLSDYFEVRLVKSAKMALSILNDLHVDLILLDIEMPDISGFEFLKHPDFTNSINKKTPVICVTSHADKEFVDRAAHCGAKDYLLKPVNPDLLYKKIDAIIGMPVKKFDAGSLEKKLQALMTAADSGDSVQSEKIINDLYNDAVAHNEIKIRNDLNDIIKLIMAYEYEKGIAKINDLLQDLDNSPNIV